jgi:hypothetical protein
MQADVERLLAQLFVDGQLRERFQRSPDEVAGEFNLSPTECEAVAKMPIQDLLVASRSYERKRQGKHAPSKFTRFKHWIHKLRNH